MSILLLAAGCTQAPQGHSAPAPTVTPLSVAVTRTSMPASAPCEGHFVAHDLNHTTAAADVVHLFESNGAGLAVGDLDNDGHLDVVLANRDGPHSILWNEGALSFRKEPFGVGSARGVAIVDVDADGWADLVLTTGTSAPQYWRNTRSTGPGSSFELTTLPGVRTPAYSLAWADFDRDGDLDLVTGSYDAGLFLEQGNHFMFGDGAGIVYYENEDGSFTATRLAEEAQALVLLTPDLNEDGYPDLIVGNDFDARDAVWLRVADGWEPATPFTETSHSTMSLDQGDVDNDGNMEIFSADMKPYDTSVKTVAAWLPLMENMRSKTTRRNPSDPQVAENVLQVSARHGTFRNQAYTRGIDATGWSWSSKFGDFDNDGFLDLYVANGMIAEELFSQLANSELVEHNQALRNRGTGHFTPAPQWQLGSQRSGRGMSMADLDRDGDLDIVVNNLGTRAQLFENRLCGGSSLEIDLFWPDTHNTRAVGALLELHTSAGTYYRDVRSVSGYLSGDPARVHVGFPTDASLERLVIHWPDATVSDVTGLIADTLMTITR